VRRKLECPEDSMSCYDFGEPPVLVPVSGVRAFGSAPVPKAIAPLEPSSQRSLKAASLESRGGFQNRTTVTTRAARQPNEAGILNKTRSLQKCDPINDLICSRGR
jgi:hypothetical protein